MAALKRVMLTAKETATTSNYAQPKSAHVSKQGVFSATNQKTNQKLNDLYKEFDAITFGTSVANEFEYATENSVAKTASFKSKLYVTSAILVMLMLAFLAVYNAVMISNLNAGISGMQSQVVVQEENYKQVYDYYSQLRNNANISDRVVQDGFEALSDEAVMQLSLTEVVQTTELETTSNWFSEFCDFLQTTFGA